jgi:hypothetical protein
MTFGVGCGVATVRHPRSRAARGYRGSTHACSAGVRCWSPAFAGMTFGVEVSGDQLASLPARIRVRAKLRREARARFRALTWIPACAEMTFEPLSSRPSGARAGTQGPRTSNAAPVAPGSRIFACGEFRDDSLREARAPYPRLSGLWQHTFHRCLRRDVDGPIHCPPWQRAAPGRRASGSRSGRPGSHPFPARRQQWRRTGDCLMRLKADGAPMRRTPKRDLGQKSPTRVPEGNPRAVRPWSLKGFPRRPARVSWSAAMRSAVADEAPAYPSQLRLPRRRGTARGRRGGNRQWAIGSSACGVLPWVPDTRCARSGMTTFVGCHAHLSSRSSAARAGTQGSRKHTAATCGP